jgi:hypothetical protein
VDWEAILAKHPQQFVSRLADWFVPKAACPPARVPTTSDDAAAAAAAAAKALDAVCPSNKPRTHNASSSGDKGGSKAASYTFPDVEDLPPVSDVLATFRQQLNALNGPDAVPV